MNFKIIAAVLLIAGLGCLGFAFLVTPSLDQYVVEDVKKAAIVDESGTNVTKCTIKSFHLERNQKYTIKLFVYMNESSTTDDTFHMKIVSNTTHNASLILDPSTVTGLSLQWASVNYPPTSISFSAQTDPTVVEATNYIAEFVGTTPTATKPLPGEYKIIIWSEDTAPDMTTLYYDLTIITEGLGITLNFWFGIIGLILIGVGVALGVISRKR